MLRWLVPVLVLLLLLLLSVHRRTAILRCGCLSVLLALILALLCGSPWDGIPSVRPLDALCRWRSLGRWRRGERTSPLRLRVAALILLVRRESSLLGWR